jgi:ABC-type bacteriocin/lantibiotic exporter with double-glycine peptidase domain
VSASYIFSSAVSQRLAQALRAELVSAMNAMPPRYYERVPHGENVTRVVSDVDEICELGSEIASQTLRAALFLVLNLVIMVHLNGRLTAAIVPLLPLAAVLQRRLQNELGRRAERSRATRGDAASILNEHLGAIPYLQAMCAEESMAARTLARWERVVRAYMRLRRTRALFNATLMTVMALGIVIILLIGSHDVLAKTLTVGGLMAFYAFALRVFEPLNSAIDLYAHTQVVVASIRRVRDVLHGPDVGVAPGGGLGLLARNRVDVVPGPGRYLHSIRYSRSSPPVRAQPSASEGPE